MRTMVASWLLVVVVASVTSTSDAAVAAVDASAAVNASSAVASAAASSVADDRPVLLTSLVATQASIAAFGWAQTILSLNRYRGVRFVTPAEWYALVVNLASGAVRVVASMAAASSTFALQLTAAIVGSLLSWTAFIIIYTDAVRLPSCPQAPSVGLGLVPTALWELNGRVVVRLPRAVP